MHHDEVQRVGSLRVLLLLLLQLLAIAGARTLTTQHMFEKWQ